MTHGFDDKGRKFNYEGEMNDWWQKEDSDEYEKRVEVMVQQAESFQVHGSPVQGKLTCGYVAAEWLLELLSCVGRHPEKLMLT